MADAKLLVGIDINPSVARIKADLDLIKPKLDGYLKLSIGLDTKTVEKQFTDLQNKISKSGVTSQLNLQSNQNSVVKDISLDVQNLTSRMDRMKVTWSSMLSDPQITARWTDLREKINAASNPEQIRQLRKEVTLLSSDIGKAGLQQKSFSDRVAETGSRLAAYLTSMVFYTAIIGNIRKAIQAVKDIDKAMTELKKVTDETSATYNKFLDDATSRAQKLGATVSDVITASADFARLGYSIGDASNLADAAVIYQNVGDGIRDISEASESIISTMKAFGIEAENSMSIVDKFNITGNNFAISSKGVGDALLNSASALSAANNTLDESIGLVVAANATIQNPNVVGKRFCPAA